MTTMFVKNGDSPKMPNTTTCNSIKNVIRALGFPLRPMMNQARAPRKLLVVIGTAGQTGSKSKEYELIVFYFDTIDSPQGRGAKFGS